VVKKPTKSKTKTTGKTRPAKKKPLSRGDLLVKDMPKVPQTKTKVGNPTEYREEFCQKLIDFMSEGYSFEAFAGEVGTSYHSLYRWVQTQTAFRDAKKIAEGKYRKYWETIGKAGMLGKIPGFNTTIWIFSMKNRFGWSDRKELEEAKTIEAVTIELPGENQAKVVSINSVDTHEISSDDHLKNVSKNAKVRHPDEGD
jgi:hypothetical protein